MDVGNGDTRKWTVGQNQVRREITVEKVKGKEEVKEQERKEEVKVKGRVK